MRFTGLPRSASVARQSGEGGFSVQTNRASCVFVRQKCFCPTKTSGPPGAGVFLQSRKQGKFMGKDTRARTGRKPKNDPADYKYSFRLNAAEKAKFDRLLAESGARDRTLFIKKAVFGGTLKVVKVDKAGMDYYVRLTEFYRQFQAVGNNYNQVVRSIRNNFGEKRAMALLYRLEKSNLELILVCRKVMALTEEYQRKWLQR